MIKRKKRLLTPARVTIGIIGIAVIAILGAWLLLRDTNIAVLNPQGTIASQQKDLIVFTLILSLVVVVPVFTILGIVVWKYREGNTKAKYTPDVDGNRWLEVLWWGIPILIIAVLGYVTIKSTHALDPYKPLVSDVKPIKVQVVALQWKWLFLYPEQEVASVNELRIPVGTPINFELTADGPMSGFWIPNLGTQTYAMTGMSAKLSLQADKVGSYRGANSNISGKGYSDMNFQTIAMSSRKDFDKWANTLSLNEAHDHLDFMKYEELAKPDTVDKPIYYHLHDINLYTRIINKYMSGHNEDSDTTMHDHMNGNEN